MLVGGRCIVVKFSGEIMELLARMEPSDKDRENDKGVLTCGDLKVYRV